MAVAVPLMLAPASASVSAGITATGPVTTAQHQAPAGPRSGLKLKGRESAAIWLGGVGAGVKVKIVGGGSGTSNCTSDETNETLTTGSGPIEFGVSFEARGSGSCAFEPSWSYFTISVSGRNTAGTGYESATRVRFGQNYFAQGDYGLTCESPVTRMSCRETSRRSVDLQAYQLSLAHRGGPLKTPRSTEMVLTNVGAGPDVAIRGGGAGTSNCTSDETSTSFRAGGGTIQQVLAFDSRGSGSCFFEPSYSDFRITVQGRATDGAYFDSRANVRYGQSAQFPGGFTATCGDKKYLIHMTCQVVDNQIRLRAEPLN